jgi:photosystem II stability/assembly factor-like uncharacterized protein
MIRSVIFRTAILSCGLSLSLFHCTRQIAGTGGGSTTTDNASVSGQVVYATGTPAKGAAVRVRPRDYVRPVGAEADSITRHDTTVNDSGRFHIDSLKVGLYRIEVNDNTSSAALLTCDIVTQEDSIVLPTDTLAAYQSIIGKVDSTQLGKGNLYVQVFGLDRIEPVDSITGAYSIPDLPPGTYSLRVISSDTSVKPVVIDTVKTDTTHVPPVLGLWTPTGGLYGGTVRSFVVGPSGTVFIGTAGSGMFRSDNNGVSWIASNNGITVPAGAVDSGSGVNSFCVIGNSIYAGTSNAGVFRSVDNGATWTAANSGMPSNVGVNALVMKNDTIVAGTNSGVFISPDSAANWIWTITGLSNPVVLSLAVSPDRANVFALCNDAAVNRSTDGGATWSAVGDLANFYGPIYWIGRFGTLVLAGGGGAIAGSKDNGATWAWRDSANPMFSTCAAMDTGSHYLYTGARAPQGIFRSADTAATFISVSAGFPSKGGTYPVFTALEVMSLGATVFAGTQENGVFVTTDFGATWTQRNIGLQAVSVKIIAAAPNPSGGSTVFAGSLGPNSFMSQNSGATWTGMNIDAITSLAAFSNTSGGYDIFAGTGGKAVFRSTDNGANWTQVGSGLTDSTIRVIAKSGTVLFAGTLTKGVFRSPDNAATWTPVNSGLTSVHVMSLAVDSFSSGGIVRLYAGTAGGIFMSGDGGNSWISLPGTSWTNGDIALAVCPSPGEAAVVFAGTWTSGLYMSTDTGHTWTNTGIGQPAANAVVYTFCVVSGASGPTVFAGTGTGLFATNNRGKNWSTLNAGLGHPAISSLAEGRDASGTRCLYAGVFGNGVWKIDLP